MMKLCQWYAQNSQVTLNQYNTCPPQYSFSSPSLGGFITLQIAMTYDKSISMKGKISMQFPPEIHTSAFADEAFPLKQVLRKFGWLAAGFCSFSRRCLPSWKALATFLFLGGGASLCVSAALAYRTLITYALLL